MFQLVPWAYSAAKAAGAAYLLYVAYRMWKGARDPIDTHTQPARHAFRQGMLINLLKVELSFDASDESRSKVTVSHRHFSRHRTDSEAYCKAMASDQG